MGFGYLGGINNTFGGLPEVRQRAAMTNDEATNSLKSGCRGIYYSVRQPARAARYTKTRLLKLEVVKIIETMQPRRRTLREKKSAGMSLPFPAWVCGPLGRERRHRPRNCPIETHGSVRASRPRFGSECRGMPAGAFCAWASREGLMRRTIVFRRLV